MAKRLRLGLIGTGVAANRLYLPALEKLASRVEVVACANRTRSKALRFARKAGIAKVAADAEELIALPEVDAVMISLPIEGQPELVRAVLDAGKPLLSEKPIAPTVKEARGLLKLAERRQVPWLVGENVAFMPALAKIESWLAAGKLGELRVIEARQLNLMDDSNPYFATEWRAQPRHPGGFVLDGGVHVAHALRRLGGMPTVLSNLAHQFNPRLPPMDTALALLRFPSGAVGTWTSCFATAGGAPMVRLLGTHGTAELGWNKATLTPRKGKPQIFESSVDSFEAQFRHFADVVTKGASLQFTPEQALADLELIEAVFSVSRRSRASGRLPV